ncbi:MAG: helix-turn-helix domain-containing protein [Lentisphaeria bacterium]|nr:helix-turn-helix domain-containing protein [Lentisphaeria bacterium]
MNNSEQKNSCKPKLPKTDQKKPICVISAKTAAEILGVSRQHISQLVKRKRLTCLQDLRPMRFSITQFAEETGITTQQIEKAARGLKCSN